MDEKKLLYDAILGGRDELFSEIAPTYHLWLQEALKTHNSEEYLSNDEQLINDFYSWLNANGHHNIISKIDRRSGEDRRGEARPGSGRREEDHAKFKQSATWLSGPEDDPTENEVSEHFNPFTEKREESHLKKDLSEPDSDEDQ